MKTKEKELSRSISAQSEAQPSIAPADRIPAHSHVCSGPGAGTAQVYSRPAGRAAARAADRRPEDMEERPLRTRDISSIGVYFFSPRLIEPGTPVELELLVVDQPFGRGSVRMLHPGAHRARGRYRKTRLAWSGRGVRRHQLSQRRNIAGALSESLNRRRPSRVVSTHKPKDSLEQFFVRCYVCVRHSSLC